MSEPLPGLDLVFRALEFSADRHRDQRRKDTNAAPYINHPIAVAGVLVTVGGVRDMVTLAAAVLHDTLEDTQTTAQEIEDRFGLEVRLLVEEMTDDKTLPRAARKQAQIQHAAVASDRAKQVKLADKICNVRDVAHAPPASWNLERRREYLLWTEQVVAGCRGVNAALEACYDEALREGRRTLGLDE
ncbi:MAG: bifunctional (p)ppGpp synthetase/guanosine-3',5'-bis(diphosphate) 3'-pyrophosphohydrolase [Candidatus Eisenbacteria bacterium]|nr:bifunctional (p)ppGpp synthetase/guanosine-3',5'-bis(diphosphate) 3'-pyrophosphohydrolase [Candidatus Eisenbacteria bacterium]